NDGNDQITNSIASVKLNPCASETSAKLSAKSSRLIYLTRQDTKARLIPGFLLIGYTDLDAS
ncbi:hypothetical protein OFN71_29380, partial [Escherichia coli]|nr:hypothetical protein [Escherichia coli]